jgi:hypothetical protein
MPSWRNSWAGLPGRSPRPSKNAVRRGPEEPPQLRRRWVGGGLPPWMAARTSGSRAAGDAGEGPGHLRRRCDESTATPAQTAGAGSSATARPPGLRRRRQCDPGEAGQGAARQAGAGGGGRGGGGLDGRSQDETIRLQMCYSVHEGARQKENRTRARPPADPKGGPRALLSL